MHHANRVRWQHKNITPRFHSAYTSLHYRFQSRPRHDQPTVIGINPGQKSDAGPSTIHSKSLFDRVWIDEEGTIHLFIFSFLYISIFFSENFYTLDTRCTRGLWSNSRILFCHYVLVVTVHRQRRVTNQRSSVKKKKKKKEYGLKKPQAVKISSTMERVFLCTLFRSRGWRVIVRS